MGAPLGIEGFQSGYLESKYLAVVNYADGGEGVKILFCSMPLSIIYPFGLSI